jgi:hypothetical protein
MWVNDVSMTKLAGWSWVVLAGLLNGVPIFAQTLNNQNLSGKYYFRHVSLGTNSPSPASLQALTLMGSITFNGSGRYDYIGQQLIGHGAAVSRSGSGAYSLDQGGFVSLDSPLRAGAKSMRASPPRPSSGRAPNPPTVPSICSSPSRRPRVGRFSPDPIIA